MELVKIKIAGSSWITYPKDSLNKYYILTAHNYQINSIVLWN